jgi:uncharacterized protein YjbI with pentapeptide repeats
MVWEITADELLERYADGERNFAGIKLVHYGLYGFRRSKHSGLDLDGVVLRDINLRGADLRNVYLIGADLTGSDLGGICLESCCLGGAIIRNANLRAACLDWSAFDNADLRGSNLDHMNASCANFPGVQIGAFEYAVLARTYLKDAHTDDGMICRGSNLLWRTTLPSGIVVEGPQWGNGRDAR